MVNPIGVSSWANQVGTAANNCVRITGGRRRNSWWFQLVKKSRRRARCSEFACHDGGMMRIRRKYGPRIGIQRTSRYAGGAAKALTRETVAANHPGYSSSGTRTTGAEMMES